jgi:hypothetical protein
MFSYPYCKSTHKPFFVNIWIDWLYLKSLFTQLVAQAITPLFSLGPHRPYLLGQGCSHWDSFHVVRCACVTFAEIQDYKSRLYVLRFEYSFCFSKRNTWCSYNPVCLCLQASCCFPSTLKKAGQRHLCAGYYSSVFQSRTSPSSKTWSTLFRTFHRTRGVLHVISIMISLWSHRQYMLASSLTLSASVANASHR